MNALFCPQSADWGSVADWVSAAISIIAALAVFYLGWEANRLGKAANHIASEATDRDDKSNRRQGRILLLYIKADVGAALRHARELERLMSAPMMSELFAAEAQQRAKVQKAILGLAMNAVNKVLDRLHLLPEEAPDAIANAVGLQRVMQDDSSALASEGKGRGQYLEGHEALLSDLKRFIEHLKVVDSVHPDETSQ